MSLKLDIVKDDPLNAENIYGKHRSKFTAQAQQLMNLRKMTALVEYAEDGSVLMAVQIAAERNTEDEAVQALADKINELATRNEIGGYLFKLLRLNIHTLTEDRVAVMSFVGVVPEAYRELTEPKTL